MNATILREFEDAARRDYREPGRHYHTEEHLNDPLELLDRMPGLGARDRRLLRWALIWHDSVYDPQRSDNEELSALRAERELVQANVAPNEVTEVARLIRLTAHHQVEAGDRLGAILVSIDLAILGSNWESYDQYVSSVRREYAEVDEAAWRKGRIKFLRAILESPEIYPEPSFNRRYGARARSNLVMELKRLAGD